MLGSMPEMVQQAEIPFLANLLSPCLQITLFTVSLQATSVSKSSYLNGKLLLTTSSKSISKTVKSERVKRAVAVNSESAVSDYETPFIQKDVMHI